MSADYVIMIYDVHRSGPVFTDNDLEETFMVKSGVTVRTPHSPPDSITPSFHPTSKSEVILVVHAFSTTSTKG